MRRCASGIAPKRHEHPHLVFVFFFGPMSRTDEPHLAAVAPTSGSDASINDEERRAWLALTLNPQLKPAMARALLQRYGLPQEVLAQPLSRVRAELGEAVAAALAVGADESAVAHTLAWAQQPGHHLIFLGDPAYPPGLLDLADAPLVLYVVGDPKWLTQPNLAVVGARQPTPGGRDTARAFAEALAARGWTVASGLAQGIDAAAHEGALAAVSAGAAGSTVAWLGTGVDRVFPAEHRGLAQRIAAAGALLSEFPLGTPAKKHHFPRRNRLIAASSRGTLVVEAAVQSGSLITARLATELGREVFAIPGSIHNPMAKGCHRLIREGAKLVESVEDILEELRGLVLAEKPHPAKRPKSIATRTTGHDALPLPFAKTNACAPSAATAGSFLPSHHPFAAPDHASQKSAFTPPLPDGGEPSSPNATVAADSQRLLAALGFDPIGFDELQIRTGLSADALSAQLLELELAGQIARLPGQRFQRLG